MSIRARLRSLTLLGLISMALLAVPQANAFDTEGFLTACTYGTLTGTLVGTASLAFTQKPGDHFERIARGASLGLYAGILLGLYVSWLPSDSKTAQAFHDINIYLTASSHGVDGAAAQYTVVRF